MPQPQSKMDLEFNVDMQCTIITTTTQWVEEESATQQLVFNAAAGVNT